MATEDDSREQGIEFGSLMEDLKSDDYPMETEGVLEKYGGREVDIEGEEKSIEEILGPMGEDTYDSAEELVQSIIGGVGDEAVGRKYYSDRGDALNEEEREQESL